MCSRGDASEEVASRGLPIVVHILGRCTAKAAASRSTHRVCKIWNFLNLIKSKTKLMSLMK